MNPTTPSKNVFCWSGRASKPTQRFSSPGYVMERPQHQSSAPTDASTYAMGFLIRQDARQQAWFLPSVLCHDDLMGTIASVLKRASTQQPNGGVKGMGWKVHQDKRYRGRGGEGQGDSDSHHENKKIRDKRHFRELYRATLTAQANLEALNLHMQQSTREQR